MRTYTQTFTGAQTWVLNVPGSYFTTLVCALAVTVRFYKGGQQLSLGECNNLLAGLEVMPPMPRDGSSAFDRVEVDVGGADTVQVGIGDGNARYNRSQGNVAVTNVGGAFSHAQASVTNADQVLLAASAARRYVLLQNNSAQVLRVRMDGGAATAAFGVRLQPGASLEVPGYGVTNAIHGFMEVADATANNVEIVAA